MGLFVDTWGWLALADRRDPAHRKVRRYYQGFRSRKERCVTSDCVLDETITLLFRRAPFVPAKVFIEGILAAIDANTLDLELVTPARFRLAWSFRTRYADKPLISFTDLTSFVIMVECGITQVMTQDHHFEEVGLGLQCVP